MGMPSATITREAKPVLGGLGGGIGMPSATITREAKPVLGGLGGGIGMPSANGEPVFQTGTIEE